MAIVKYDHGYSKKIISFLYSNNKLIISKEIAPKIKKVKW